MRQTLFQWHTIASQPGPEGGMTSIMVVPGGVVLREIAFMRSRVMQQWGLSTALTFLPGCDIQINAEGHVELLGPAPGDVTKQVHVLVPTLRKVAEALAELRELKEGAEHAETE